MTVDQAEEQRFTSGNCKTMVFVAHPDDESIGASFFLQRQRRVCVAFATSGGHTTLDHLQRLGLRSSAEYAARRESEAFTALRRAGRPRMLFFRGPDGGLKDNLVGCFERLTRAVEEHKPEFVLTHAFEGGHSDHDCCSFLVSRLSARHGIHAWEMPSYYRKYDEAAARAHQGFRDRDIASDKGKPSQVEPSESESAAKRDMLESYASQFFTIFERLEVDVKQAELYRPQKHYDYTNPSHDYYRPFVPSSIAMQFKRFDEWLTGQEAQASRQPGYHWNSLKLQTAIDPAIATRGRIPNP